MEICDNCKYFDCSTVEEPCVHCKNTVPTYSSEYNTREFKWEPMEATDNVNHPNHYTAGDIECIDAIEAAVTGLTGIEAVLTGNIMKYIWRWKYKNGLEDLNKAKWYLERLIKLNEE